MLLSLTRNPPGDSFLLGLILLSPGFHSLHPAPITANLTYHHALLLSTCRKSIQKTYEPEQKEFYFFVSPLPAFFDTTRAIVGHAFVAAKLRLLYLDLVLCLSLSLSRFLALNVCQVLDTHRSQVLVFCLLGLLGLERITEPQESETTKLFPFLTPFFAAFLIRCLSANTAFHSSFFVVGGFDLSLETKTESF